MKKEARYTEKITQTNMNTQEKTTQWESGFGIETEDKWITHNENNILNHHKDKKQAEELQLKPSAQDNQ